MKLSLISATSIFALSAVAVGPAYFASAHAALVSAPAEAGNISDLMPDSGEGAPVANPIALATSALEIVAGGGWVPSSTGPVDQGAAQRKAFPAIPLAAARSLQNEEAIAASLPGTDQMDPLLKTRVVGEARLAPLIGTVGDGPTAREKPGNTVFVTLGSAPGFNDGVLAGGGGTTSFAYGFSSSGTSTAAITVATAGFLSRPAAAGGAPYVVMAKSLQATTPANGATTDTAFMPDKAMSTLGFNYAPAGSAAAEAAPTLSSSVVARTDGGQARVVQPVPNTRIEASQAPPAGDRSPDSPASFSAATTASGAADGAREAALVRPVGAGKIQTSENQTGRIRTSDAATASQLNGQPNGTARGARMTDVVQPDAAGKVQPGKVQTGQVQAGRGAIVESDASFSNAVTASGVSDGMVQAALIRPSGMPLGATSRIQTSQLQPDLNRLRDSLNAEIRSDQLRSVEATADFPTVIKLSQVLDAPDGMEADGTRSVISASVSANPSAAAALYLANVANQIPSTPRQGSAEAFSIGTPGTSRTLEATTVSEPLGGKVVASAGPLNNELALP